MKNLELIFGVSFLAVIMAFIIPEIQTRVEALNYTSGAGIIANNYALIIVVVIVAIVVGALILEGKD